LIRAKNLSFSYPEDQRPALTDLNFQIGRGSLCCLLGANGSGKTTLLRILAGLLRAEGELCFAQASPTRRLLPQNPELYILGATVEEDLLLGLEQRSPVVDKALALLKQFDLGDKREQPVHYLSFGEKRKLCLASALAAEPELLLLDEPFAGLDYPSALFVRENMTRNKEIGLTQIFSTHDLDLTADLVEHFIVLRQGLIIAQGSGAEVAPYLEQAGTRQPCQWYLGRHAPLWQGDQS